MKKINILYVAILFVIVGKVYGGIKEDLITKLSLIDTQINTIDLTVVALKAVHQKLETQLINNINNKINNEINPSKKKASDMKAGLDGLGSGKKIALAVFGFGEITDALGFIVDALSKTSTVLGNVNRIFRPQVGALDPATDPQRIYAGFADGRQKLVQAKSFLQQISQQIP